MKVDPDRMRRTWDAMCTDIGERLAGTEAEARAAAAIVAALEQAGCTGSRMESFACRSRRGARVSVEAGMNAGPWHQVEAQAVTGAASTPGVVEGPVAWLEMPEQADRLRSGSLEGRICVLYGPLPEIAEHHRLLVEARPLAVVHVDHRLPFSWAKADGTYPQWVRRYGFPPVVTVPFTDAWRWREARLRLRVSVEMTMVDALSANVAAERVGSGPGLVLISAHHDTQAGNVGADDNASGVVALIELAHMLAPTRRTFRFVSFGAEEQLSVGAAAYVEAHREEMEDIDLVINFDSIASPLGHHGVVCAGDPSLARYAQARMQAAGLPVATNRRPNPFSDHFPFTVHGVPALWYYRENFPGGRWQHHSPHDNLENVSVRVVAEVVEAAAALIADVASGETLPFTRGPDLDARGQTLAYARELYGGIE